MAYWYDDLSDKSPTSRRCCDFIIDSAADVASLPGINKYGTPQPDDSTVHLPVAKGSSALCIGSGSLYMLNSENTWVEV